MTVDTVVTAINSTVTFNDGRHYCQRSPDREDRSVSIRLDGQVVGNGRFDVPDADWYTLFRVPGEPGTYTYGVTCTSTAETVTYAPVTIRVLPPRPAGVSARIGEVTRDGCTVSVPVITTGDCTFQMRVTDDGRKLEEVVWDTQGEMTKVITWTITGRPDPTFPGDIGFRVRVNGSTWVNEKEPQEAGTDYSYPDELADECSAAVPITAGLVEDPSSVRPGQTVTVEGKGLLSTETVDVILEDTGERVGGVVRGSEPRYWIEYKPYSVTATRPDDLAPGEHALVVRGKSSLRSARIPFTVPGDR